MPTSELRSCNGPIHQLKLAVLGLSVLRPLRPWGGPAFQLPISGTLAPHLALGYHKGVPRWYSKVEAGWAMAYGMDSNHTIGMYLFSPKASGFRPPPGVGTM